MPLRWAVLATSAVFLCGCGKATPAKRSEPAVPSIPERIAPPPLVDREWPILETHLEIDVARRTGRARLVFDTRDADAGLTVEVGRLEIVSVSDSQGRLRHTHRDDRLDVGVPAKASSVEIEYRYGLEITFNGVMPSGSTFTWPGNCGNVFPCRSAPRHGSKYTIVLTGVADGQRAVYPTSIDIPVPAYMIAWAVGDYHFHSLGKTSGGTEVGFWSPPSGTEIMRSGTAPLVAGVDWLERTLGPYPFGKRTGPVLVQWAGGARLTSVEHHPFWHVTEQAAFDPRGQIHDAAHAWFGDGVRMACWEDFLLSEGLASYLAARAMEEAKADVAVNIFADYRGRLDSAIAWPAGCGNFDVEVGRTTTAHHYKTALFLYSLEKTIGRPALDAALGSFFRANVGTARGFGELVDHISRESGYDASLCADEWLREPSAPEDDGCP